MTYATLREALYDFFTHNAPLVSDGDYYSSEDVFTALPYAKGRRYFDAVARTQRTAKNSFGCFVCFWNIGCSKVFGGYRRWPLHLTNHVHANVP